MSVYEDDQYCMASVVAEKLMRDGAQAGMVTPRSTVAQFSEFTLELVPIHKGLAQLGVEIIANHEIVRIDGEVYGFRTSTRACLASSTAQKL